MDIVMKKIFALLLVLNICIFMLTGCQSTQSSETQPANDSNQANQTDQTTKEELRVLNYLYSSKVTDWNYLVATSNTPAEYIDSLVEYDNYGICKPCIAETWERSEDGLTWTFHLRKGVKWMTYKAEEYGTDVKAEDFVTSAQYILNANNASRLADMLFTLKGAEEYYDATAKGEITDFSSVGVKAVDDYTLQYTLVNPLPYFLSSVTYKCYFPANAKFMEECGEQFSTDNTTMLYCGEFIMTEYEPQGKIVALANPTYWDKGDMYIDAMYQTYNAEADTVAPEMFLRGEINYAEIPTEQLDNWLNDSEKSSMIRPSRPSFYSYYYMFNFFPNFEETTVTAPNGKEYKMTHENWLKAANNVNFRKSIYKAFDKIQAVKVDDPYNADAHIMNTITPSDFVSVDGIDYTELQPLKNITSEVSYNKEEALKYRDKAIEELKAAGANFPIVIYMPYNAESTIQAQRVQVVADQWENDLNTPDFEYIKVVYEPYADSDFSNNTMRAGNYCIMPTTWMADYLDPLSYTDPFTIVQNRTNFIYMADGMSKFSDTIVDGSKEGKDGKYYFDIIYDNMVKDATQECVDLSLRYNSFAKIEKWLIEEQCLVMPYMRGGTGYVASSLSPFESQYAAFGASSGRYKYQHIYEKGISSEEFYKQYDEWKKERAQIIADLAKEGKKAGIDY